MPATASRSTVSSSMSNCQSTISPSGAACWSAATFIASVGTLGTNTHSPRALLVSVVMLASSEWNVIVREVRSAGEPRGLLLRRPLLALLAALATALATAAEHLHLVGDDVRVVALLPVVAGVLAVADPALDVHLRTLAQVLGRDLAELAEEGHAVPFGLFLGVAVAVLSHTGRREADLGHGHAALRVLRLRDVAQVADENCFVDATGHD